MSSNSGYHYILNASIISVEIVQTNRSMVDGPFKKGFYDVLKFPIHTTLMSQQSLDYGNTKTEE